MGEITVNVPDPEPPPAPSSTPVDQSLALAVGELKGELAAQKTILETVLHNQSASEGVLQEIAARTELLLDQESEPEESESEPEPVVIPPPLLLETTHPPADPTTPELHPPPIAKRRLGMFHGW